MKHEEQLRRYADNIENPQAAPYALMFYNEIRNAFYELEKHPLKCSVTYMSQRDFDDIIKWGQSVI